MNIYKSTYDRIIGSYPHVPPEQGGIIGIKDNIVCEYFHDVGKGSCLQAIYEPSIILLNKCIELWSKNSIEFAGIIHSHMSQENELSIGDIEYIEKIFNILPSDIKQLYFPLVFPEQDKMISNLAKRSGNSVVILKDEINVID